MGDLNLSIFILLYEFIKKEKENSLRENFNYARTQGREER